jgi:hypothetical protein
VALALASCWRSLGGTKRHVAATVLAVVLLAGAIALYPEWTAHPTSRGYLQGLVDPHR